ncbi:UNVERIFIED_CONTAM: hypothetical protein Slati_2514000 [Sesamum latifolium]|uniref:Uncharacterized protein n=1 Tax=Sesamum latifolium TaxID=2727402 RepID=A0AAW2WJC3_9LAMI
MAHNGASPVVHVVIGESFACICSSRATPPVRKVRPSGSFSVPAAAPAPS